MANAYQSMITPNDQKNYVNDAGYIEWAAIPLNVALDKLKTSREGLSTGEAEKRLEEHGPNKLPETKVNKLM
ncbi:hypothetical protein DYB38_014054, partial [Aphanomyces astaci]